MENLIDLKVMYYNGYYNNTFYEGLGKGVLNYPKSLKTLYLGNIDPSYNDIEGITIATTIEKITFHNVKFKERNYVSSLINLFHLEDLTLEYEDQVGKLPRHCIVPLQNLKHLTINGVLLNKVTLGEIEKLTGLKTIVFKNIYYNGSINKYFFKSMTGLKDVYIEFNSRHDDNIIKEIDIRLPSSVETLYFSGVDLTLTNIDKITLGAKNVKKITITDMNHVDEINLYTFARFEKLTEFIFKNSGYIYITNLKELTTIKKLTLENIKIDEKMVNDISQISGLEEITFNHCLHSDKLIDLSPLENLKNVISFEITGSDYDNLISVIHSFRDLKKLTITGNDQITDFIDCNILTNLEYINFHNTNLKTVPESIMNLKNLKYL